MDFTAKHKIMDSYLIHMHIVMKYRPSSIKEKKTLVIRNFAYTSILRKPRLGLSCLCQSVAELCPFTHVRTLLNFVSTQYF